MLISPGCCAPGGELVRFIFEFRDAQGKAVSLSLPLQHRNRRHQSLGAPPLRRGVLGDEDVQRIFRADTVEAKRPPCPQHSTGVSRIPRRLWSALRLRWLWWEGRRQRAETRSTSCCNSCTMMAADAGAPPGTKTLTRVVHQLLHTRPPRASRAGPRRKHHHHGASREVPGGSRGVCGVRRMHRLALK